MPDFPALDPVRTGQGFYPCPVGCPVLLQRTAHGTIADGIAAHLTWIHKQPESEATATARAALRAWGVTV